MTLEHTPPVPKQGTWFCYGMIFTLFVLIFDQVSKWYVLTHLMNPPKSIPITSFFNIVLTWNKGVSFGLLSSNSAYGAWILMAIALFFSAILILWIWQAESKIIAIGFGCVLGGALGNNLFDRLRFGAVTDFLDFHAFGVHFWTFNVADSGITIGVALVLLDYIMQISTQKKIIDRIKS